RTRNEESEQEFWEIAGYESDVSWYDDDLDNVQTLFNVLDLKDRDWVHAEQQLKTPFYTGASDRTKKREKSRQKMLAEEGSKHANLITDYFVSPHLRVKSTFWFTAYLDSNDWVSSVRYGVAKKTWCKSIPSSKMWLNPKRRRAMWNRRLSTPKRSKRSLNPK